MGTVEVLPARKAAGETGEVVSSARRYGGTQPMPPTAPWGAGGRDSSIGSERSCKM